MQQPNMYQKVSPHNQNAVTPGATSPQMQGPPMQQSQQQQQQAQQGKSLWIGDVLPWMNEKDIAMQFDKIAVVTNVKLIKDKITNKPVGYGFVEFQDFETARDVFTTLNGKKIPGQDNRYFKLNWASHGGGVARAYNGNNPMSQGGFQGNGMGYNNMRQNHPNNNGPPNHYMGDRGAGAGGYGGGNSNHQQQEAFQVYVGDLDPVVTNHNLLQYFKQIYNSVCEAKVIVDPVSRKSKGYGFIKFLSKEESERALQEMNGKQLYGRAIKMNYASQRTPQTNNHMNNRFSQAPQPHIPPAHAPNNLAQNGYLSKPPIVPHEQHHGNNHANHQNPYPNQFMGPQGTFNGNSQIGDPMLMAPQPGFNKMRSGGYPDPFMDNMYPGGFGQGQRQGFNQQAGMPNQMAQNYNYQGQSSMNNDQPQQMGQNYPQQTGGQNMTQNYMMPPGVNQQYNNQYPGANMNAGQMPNHLMNVASNMRPAGRQQDPQQQFNGNNPPEFGNSQQQQHSQYKNTPQNNMNNPLNAQKQLSQHAIDGNHQALQDQGYNELSNTQLNQKGGTHNGGNADLAGGFNQMNHNSQKVNDQQQANSINQGGDLNNFNGQNMPHSYNNQNVSTPNALDGYAGQTADAPDTNALNKANYPRQNVMNDQAQPPNYMIPQQPQNPDAQPPQTVNEMQNRMHNPEAYPERAEDQSGAQMLKGDLPAHSYDPLTSVNAKSAPPSSLAPHQDTGHSTDGPAYPLKGDTSQLQQEYARIPANAAYGGNPQQDNPAQMQQAHQFYYPNPHGGFVDQQQQPPVLPYDHMAQHHGAQIKSKLAIDPISSEEIARMNQEYLEPLIDNSEVLYIL